jgi:peroxiredoxin
MINRRQLHLGLSVVAASALSLTAFVSAAHADAVLGAPAPDFTGVTASGETVSLSDFVGETVVLEWTNHDCPYVRRHYEGNMQAQQAAAVADGVTWIQVISSAPGEQGHVDAETALALNVERGATVDATILDPEGVIGVAYDARTTPQMYIIDGDGVLQFNGGIDDKPRGPADEATQFVPAALAAVAAGEAPSPAQTRPYGCNVKYAEG